MSEAQVANNPLLVRSTLPYQLPQWALIHPEHIVPAVKYAMAQQREIWEQVASDTDAPTVENTVEVLDNSGRLLAEVSNIAYTLISSVGGPELEAVENELGPLYAEHENAYRLNEGIYKRFQALDPAQLDAESAHFVREELAAFKRGGIELDDEGKTKLRELDAKLAAATVSFGQRAVQAMSDNELIVDDVARLEGLSAEQLQSFKRDDATFHLPLDNYSNQPLQAQLKRPDTRAALLERSLSRGLGEFATSDTREVILEIVRLRAQRAALLGYPHHAAAVADAAMAKSTPAVMELLTSVTSAALTKAKQEAQELKTLAASDGLQFAAADWLYYLEQQRAQSGLDDGALKEYFLLENVVDDGIFFAAHELYGLTFVERTDLAGYLPSVRTWEVFNEDGEGIALFQADFFRRKGKHGGAWMNPIVDGSKLKGTKPVIMNNCNFDEPAPGQPCLLTWDNVITVFHEFGHALHGMLTQTKYRSTAGTAVSRDFVETPSQMNEMWALNSIVLANYARHWQTGEALPAELIDALTQTAAGAGFEAFEQHVSALLDQAWHQLTESDIPTDVAGFENKVLAELGIDYKLIPPRYRSGYFNHTFGGGYDAGYYSYTWAEALAAEIENWYRTEGARDGDGGLNREAGRTIAREILSRGNSRDPMDSFKAVLGREPNAQAILHRRGLI